MKKKLFLTIPILLAGLNCLYASDGLRNSVYENGLRQKLIKRRGKIEINIFGGTYHFSHSKPSYKLQIGTPKIVANPGIGINYYLRETIYLTANYIDNCWGNPFYSAGINVLFLKKIFNALYFRADYGIQYTYTKYASPVSKPVPFLSFGLQYKNGAVHLTYVPRKFSSNKKDSFLFFYYSVFI